MAFSETIAKSISPSDRVRLAVTSKAMHEALAADLQRDKIIASSFEVNALDGFREILASARMLDEFRRGEVLTAICPALTRLPEPEFQPAFNEFLQIAQALTRCPDLLAAWMEALAEGNELNVYNIGKDAVSKGELPESAAFTYGIGDGKLELQLAAAAAALPEIRSRGHIRDVCRRRGISHPSAIRSLMDGMTEVAQVAVSSGKNVKAVAQQLDMDDEYVPLLEWAAIDVSTPARVDIWVGENARTVRERYGIEGQRAVEQLESLILSAPLAEKAISIGTDARKIIERFGIEQKSSLARLDFLLAERKKGEEAGSLSIAGSPSISSQVKLFALGIGRAIGSFLGRSGPSESLEERGAQITLLPSERRDQAVRDFLQAALRAPEPQSRLLKELVRAVSQGGVQGLVARERAAFEGPASKLVLEGKNVREVAREHGITDPDLIWELQRKSTTGPARQQLIKAGTEGGLAQVASSYGIDAEDLLLPFGGGSGKLYAGSMVDQYENHKWIEQVGGEIVR
ncbi:MAG: hypothetical protein JF606_28350 [Burkholderiales bacterium]|nr:hypothetical protein [Burkholderiales bacterium]